MAEESNKQQCIFFFALDTASPLIWRDKDTGIGDVNSFYIGEEEYSLSTLKGLKEWFSQADKYDPYTKVAAFTTEGLVEWNNQGCQYARQIKEMLPRDMKLFYCHINGEGEKGVRIMRQEILTKEEIAKRKYEWAKQACADAKKMSQDKALETLKEEAFKTIKEHPGFDLSIWAMFVCQKHYDILVEAFGKSPANINNSLVKLWRSFYYDERSGWEYTFEQWSEVMGMRFDEYIEVVNERYRKTMEQNKKIEPVDLSTPIPMPEPEKPLMCIDDGVEYNGKIIPGDMPMIVD